MAEISSAEPRPAYHTALTDTDEKKADFEHVDQTGAAQANGLSEAQRNLALAAEAEKAKSLGTFTAIKYYWVAFLWSQFASFGMILVGYDGTVRSSSPCSVPMLTYATSGHWIRAFHSRVPSNIGL